MVDEERKGRGESVWKRRVGAWEGRWMMRWRWKVGSEEREAG